MKTLGEPSGNQFDTPLVPAEDAVTFLRHSTGLVRDWILLHGRYNQFEAALDALW